MITYIVYLTESLEQIRKTPQNILSMIGIGLNLLGFILAYVVFTQNKDQVNKQFQLNYLNSRILQGNIHYDRISDKIDNLSKELNVKGGTREEKMLMLDRLMDLGISINKDILEAHAELLKISGKDNAGDQQ